MPAALAALQVINMILAEVPMIASMYANISARRGMLEQMIAAKRDPTPQEWQDLTASIAAASATLMAAQP
ncbi:MAG TPA: hypothetical protein VLH12_08580 [Usitatibacter sp.]|jgi:hypothetical protein|nr:hypothetical protein [Usitatibacter sp.]